MTGDDNKKQYGAYRFEKKTYAIHGVRSDGRLYLRIHRSRRRYDDAADPDQRTWL